MLFLLTAEILLRLVGYGYPTSFLVPATINDQASWTANRWFGRRYFGPNYERRPAPFLLARDKPADTVRVFVLGESAAMGDPLPEFGLPRVLQTLLAARYPNAKFEVVNAAMTGINSHVVRSIAADCAAADGDLWVVYMGNNEVVGPFGAGTVFGPQVPGSALIASSLAIKGTRFGQLLGSLEQWLNPPPASKREWGGMLMFVENQIRSDDARMPRVYDHFNNNLNAILDAAADAGVGVVLSTVAVNLRECAPFASLHRPGLTDAQLKEWQAAYKSGVALRGAGDHRAAIEQFRGAAKIDDSHADLSFALAGSLLASGDRDAAAREFARARDQDALRFRCDSRLNDIIRKAAANRPNQRLRLADAEQAFARASRDGVPGNRWFYEHVHLRLAGNYLLARTIADQLESLLPDRVRDDADAAPTWLTEDKCAERLGWNAWNRVLALDDVIGRMADPPFTNQANHKAQLDALNRESAELRSRVESDAKHADDLFAAALAAAPDDPFLYAQRCQLHSLADNRAVAVADARRATELLPICVDHWLLLGSALASNEEFEESVDAYQHALEFDDQNPFALLNLARVYASLGRRADAMATYRRAVALDPPSGTAYLELGRLQEEAGELSAARESYRLALEHRVMRSQDLMALAQLCVDQGWPDEAARNFLDAAALSPGDVNLRIAAGQSLAALKYFDDAREQFRLAVAAAPDAGPAHLMYAIELGRAQQHEQALPHFRDAVRLMPAMIDARLNLALALSLTGRREESLREFQRVLEQDPGNATAQRYIAELSAPKSN